MKKTVFLSYPILLLFAFLCVLFIPFSFNNLNFQAKITAFLFEDLLLFIAKNCKSIYMANPNISSDSTTLFLLVFVLFCLAVILVLGCSFFSFFKKIKIKIEAFFQIIITYYLSIIVLKYGFDKLFKTQFYLPEPNTLYTPLGYLDKDILYWSTMGTSPSYSVFLGLIEIVPALLLWHKKTRNLGLLILFGVLTHVVMVNFSFDISVKLFSVLLLLMCFLLIVPNLKKLIDLFIFNKATTFNGICGSELFKSKTVRYGLKLLVFLFMFYETAWPYLQSNQFNDDKTPRLALHGAYEVIKPTQTTTATPYLLNIKRIFIHRQYYLIFQYENESFESFQLEINKAKKQFTLTNQNNEAIKLFYEIDNTSKNLTLNFPEIKVTIATKKLNWQKLPLLQPLFHITVDEIK